MDEIYIDRGDELVAVRSTDYESEAVLQELLTRHTALLAGGQMRSDDPPRWLLIGREVGVPDADGGAERYALDHLFVDQNAVLTLVEVKRASNRQIRREVVGQMLDYAANGTVYWRVARLRQILGMRLEADGDERLGDSDLDDPVDAAVRDHIGPDTEPGDFWQAVEANLRQGRFRLLFVADAIPMELQRIIEYLNEKLRDAEVLGVEVRKYDGDGVRAFVPRVVGLTASAAAAKPHADGQRLRRSWSARGAEGVLAKRANNQQRGPGRQLTEDEMRAYVTEVIDHPGDAIDEMEYAYWIEGLRLSRRTWLARWNDVARELGRHDKIYPPQMRDVLG